MSEIQAPAVPARDGPEGIGGWLLLPLVGLVVMPLRGLRLLLGDASWPAEIIRLLSRGQKAFLIGEFGLNVVLLVVMPVVLLVLLLKYKRRFPRLYAAWGIVTLVFLIGDFFLGDAMFPGAFGKGGVEPVDETTIDEIIHAIVLVVIWVPYVLLSRRSRNTFTR